MSGAGQARLDIFRSWAPGLESLWALEESLERADLPAGLLELVRIRASQINACAYCIDMHTRKARDLGESVERLVLLAAWDESSCYSDRERAALRMTEEITGCSTGVADATIEDARRHFTPTELAQLTYAIAAINAWNRLAVADRTPHPQHA